jgi:enoyl-CoA hydratase/carnithine racemase
MLYYPEAKASCLKQHRFAYLKIELVDHELKIRLNRPDKKNALNHTLMREMAYALSIAYNDSEVWLIRISAEGDVFCAGADLKTFTGEPDEPNNSSIRPYEGHVLIGELFKNVLKPCIAQVEGPIYAGGFLITGSCQFVVVADHLRFSLPEVQRGIFPFQVMATLLKRAKPMDVLRFCILGEEIDVHQALQLGLITDIVPAYEVSARADRLADQIKKGSPSAIRAGLKAYVELEKLAPHEQHFYLREQLTQLLESTDAKEGIAAFREKRAPKWSRQ